MVAALLGRVELADAGGRAVSLAVPTATRADGLSTAVAVQPVLADPFREGADVRVVMHAPVRA